jgi:AcrR family transcriptional regulator
MVRAAPLPPDARRAALLAATEPLLQRYGRDVSTRQIAEAAGVAEGTIFRVFPTKDALVDACVAEAFDVQHSLDELAAIGAQPDLESCVVAAVTVLQDRMRRVIALFHTLRMPPPSPAEAGELRARQASDNERLTAVVVDLLRPFTAGLRRPLPEAAAALRTMTFALTHPMLSEGKIATPEQIADLLLHGLAAPDDPDLALLDALTAPTPATPEDAPC